MSINTTILDSYRELMEDEADEFIADILNSFYENSTELLKTLRDSIVQGQPSEFVRAAHSFKSTSATVGAEELSALAADLEKKGKSGEINDLAPAIDALQKAYESAKEELQKLYG